MKTINIKGKDYTLVSDRVMEFHKIYPTGDINTTITYDGKYVRCRAVVIPEMDKPERQFTGHAEEDRSQGMVNKTNATENAETGAVGRALGFLGIGIIAGIASADEMAGAIHKQEADATIAEVKKSFGGTEQKMVQQPSPRQPCPNPRMDELPFPIDVYVSSPPQQPNPLMDEPPFPDDASMPPPPPPPVEYVPGVSEADPAKETKQCKNCNNTFVAKFKWSTLCVPCYIKSKEQKAT